ncbi:MAG TPA: hypothetical protein VF461_05225 [Gemmatimonadaceae bacterium]
MARRLCFTGLLLLCGAIASCSDSTAPAATFLIVVSPDTVHLSQNVVPRLASYTERLVSAGQSKVWITAPDVETEVAPGKWQAAVQSTDPNNLYLQGALGDATVWTPVTDSDLAGTRTFYVPLGPGRYRLRQRFQVTAPSATQATGEISEATSNPFVVVTP